MVKLVHIILIGILLGCLIISITPSIADKPLDGKPTKVFDAVKKEVVITDESTQLTIKQISIKQGVSEFEEIFEITASKDYIPSHNKDFKLNFDYRKQLPKNRVISSEWFVYKNNKWIPLRYGKILKGNTYKYKLIVHKKAELGNNEIRVVPSFLDVKCEELSWWNVSWQYKINSTLDDVPSGGYTYELMVHSGSGTNTQTDIYLNGNGATNFKDIRFVLDDTTELDYWIERNSTNLIRVWIDIPTNGKVYTYYGNSEVSTTSDLRSVGVFGDDFRDNTKWTTTDATLYRIENGTLVFKHQSAVSHPQIYTGTFTSLKNYSFQYKIKVTGCYNGSNVHASMQNTNNIPYSHTGNFSGMFIHECGISNNRFCRGYQLFQTFSGPVGSIFGNSFRGIKIYYYNGTGIIEQWNVDFTSMTHTRTLSGGDLPLMNRFVISQRTGNGATGEIDNILIRKYQDPEPEWQTWSSAETEEIYTETSTNQYNNQRKLARTSEGYLHRVYSKYDGSNYEIYYELSTDGGNNWANEKLTDSTTNCTNPTILTDSNDSVWIIYKNESQIWSLYKEGLLDWNNTKITNTDTNTVSCAIDSNDNLHLVFEQVSDISYTYYNGITWSASTYLTTSGVNQYPSISIDSNDYLHVVWEEDNNIRYRNKTGAGWQSIYNITESETYNQTYPCIAVDINNNIHVTWQTEDYQIKYRQNTGTWQATQTVCDGGAYEQRNPTIVISDGTYIIWYGLSATYNTNYIIRYKKIGSGIVDILHPSGKNAVYPNAIHAFHPKFCGADNCHSNIPETGFAIVYEEKGTESEIKYYSNSLGWRCPNDHYTLVVRAKSSSLPYPQIYNFTATFDSEEVTTTNGEARFRCKYGAYYDLDIISSGYQLYHTNVWLNEYRIITAYLIPEGGNHYNLTVKAKDHKTNSAINSFSVSVDTGQEGSTYTGSITFTNISEGWREVIVSATGYYAGSESFSFSADTTKTLLLVSIEESEPGGISYKHLVEFQVVDYWTNPISDVLVEAKGIETTMGSWDWIWEIFGIKNETINESLVMNGTTDDLGRISFEMFEAIKYQITFTNAEKGVDETLNIYPKDEKYVVVVGTATSTKHIDDHVSWNLTAEQVNTTHFKLSLEYIDYLSVIDHLTITLKFFVLNSSGNEIYNKTFANPYSIHPNNANYIVEKKGGEEYMWGFIAEHEIFGEIKDIKVITFKQFIDLGLEDEKYYTWISIALLIFFTGMFSVTLSKFGYFLVPGMGMLFWYVGWLGTNITLLTIAMGLGVLAYLGTREKEKGL